MERQNVGSSNLHSAGWKDNVLEVAFRDKAGNVRAVWQYSAPKEAYDGLINAPSAGKYFNEHIKGLFDGTKVGG